MAPVASAPPRRPVKWSGRNAPVDELRERCLARVRKNRDEVFSRLRDLNRAGDVPEASSSLRDVARDVVRAEASMMPVDWSSCAEEKEAQVASFEACEWDEEEMLRLEEELYWELQREAVRRAEEEAAWLLDLQNEEDCELYEQYLLGGVPCPLCGTGRLERREGELCCSTCMEMRTQLLDEGLSLEDISEQLGLAEDRHRQAGCCSRALFQMTDRSGFSLLCLQCEHCGWDEVAL